ncbi:hypothetical protein EGT36_01775 [Agrobacterium sp. FDAARGOS_525]|uniref:hypothetical protein n=1 Tax=Agrobacterium sp. FDAARGOS_525 TaxID=2420311 RepID=UPI000F66581E|nr:hypothetical protein [Agrobacterium sp. FDAARGOS_525]RSC36153.1 hypothetical protein EGT36_01775 [Agrobacterium sp. FDAARGOS_525]
MFRKALFCSLALALGTGCAAAQGVTVKSKRPVSDGWFKGEQLVMTERSGGVYSERQGKTSEGYQYSISRNGAKLMAGQQTWGVSCSVDSMDDKTYCHLMLIGGMKISFSPLDAGSSSLICLNFSDFTPVSGMIRFDKLPAQKTDRKGCALAQPFRDISQAKAITIRTDQMGPDYKFEHQLSLDGFRQASELLSYLRLNGANLSFD